MTAGRAGMRRIRRLGSTDDAGVTLIELLVSIIVSSVLLTIVAGMFISVSHATVNANATRVSTGTGAVAMDEISRVIRSACDYAVSGSTTPNPGVVAGTASSVTVVSYVDANSTTPLPVQVTFSMNSSNAIVETRTAAVASNGYWSFTGATTTRVLSGASPSSDQVQFAYYDAKNVLLPLSGAGLSAAQTLAAASVSVTVTIPAAQTSGNVPVVITNSVGMPNLSLDGGGSS